MNSEDLYNAIEKNDIDFFISNMPANFDINDKDINNVPFLIHVAKFGRVEMLQHMIKNNVNINMTFTSYGHEVNAVYLAAGGGHLECLKLLIKAGGEYKQGFGTMKQTPLQTACIQGTTDCVEYLVKQMSTDELNIRDSMYGWTAAHGAAGRNNVDCLKILHVAGADFSIKSSSFPKETPLDVARRRYCTAAVSYLESIHSKDVKIISNVINSLRHTLWGHNELRGISQDAEHNPQTTYSLSKSG